MNTDQEHTVSEENYGRMKNDNAELYEHTLREEARLDRIEIKIDKLTDVVSQIAVVDQKLASIAETQSNDRARMNKHSEKIDEIKNQQLKNTQVIQGITFVVGVSVASLIGILFKLLGS